MEKINSGAHINGSTRLLVLIMGVLTGLTGSMHGMAEILQGNRPTEGLILAGIGVLTVIPNYLYTGIIATLLGIFIIAWIVTSIHKKHGPAVFLAFSILLFLSGGGIAIIAAILLTWALAKMINSPLTWWRRALYKKAQAKLAGYWKFSIISCFACFIAAILIWLILTPPGNGYKVPVYQYACWSFLAMGFVLLIITIISGLANDIN